MSRVKELLESLNVEDSRPTLTISVSESFVSPIPSISGLGPFIRCPDKDNQDQCAFNLNNDDVTKLAAALHQLEFLLLGYACPKNIYALRQSRALFRQTQANKPNIVDDFEDISGDPQFRGPCSLPLCAISHLGVYRIPLDLDTLGFETVAIRMVPIFPRIPFPSSDGVLKHR